MSMSERIDSLRAKHAALDQQLEEETHRPFPNADELNRLKRAKLKLKDEMARLTSEEAPAG
jgi:hypothetical protein